MRPPPIAGLGTCQRCGRSNRLFPAYEVGLWMCQSCYLDVRPQGGSRGLRWYLLGGLALLFLASAAWLLLR